MCPPEEVLPRFRGFSQHFDFLSAPDFDSSAADGVQPDREKWPVLEAASTKRKSRGMPRDTASSKTNPGKKKYRPRLIKDMSPEARERCRAKNRRASARYRMKKPKVGGSNNNKKQIGSNMSKDSDQSGSAPSEPAASVWAADELHRCQALRDSKLAMQQSIKERIQHAEQQLLETQRALELINRPPGKSTTIQPWACSHPSDLPNISLPSDPGACFELEDEPVWPFRSADASFSQQLSVADPAATCEAFAEEQLKYNLAAVHLLRTDMLLKLDQYGSFPYNAIGCAEPISLGATISNAVRAAEAGLGCAPGGMGKMLLQSTASSWTALSASVLALRSKAQYMAHEPPPPGAELTHVFDDGSSLDRRWDSLRVDLGPSLDTLFDNVLDDDNMDNDTAPSSSYSLGSGYDISERASLTGDPALPLVVHALTALGAISSDGDCAAPVSAPQHAASTAGSQWPTSGPCSYESTQILAPFSDPQPRRSAADFMALEADQRVSSSCASSQRDAHAATLEADLEQLRMQRMRSERVLAAAPGDMFSAFDCVSSPACLPPEQARMLSERVLEGLNLSPRQVEHCRVLRNQYLTAIQTVSEKLAQVAGHLNALVTDVTVGDLLPTPGCEFEYTRALELYKSLQRDNLHNSLKLRRLFILKVLDPLQAAKAQVLPLPYREDALQLIELACASAN